jgi:hypothetical protein
MLGRLAQASRVSKAGQVEAPAQVLRYSYCRQPPHWDDACC